MALNRGRQKVLREGPYPMTNDCASAQAVAVSNRRCFGQNAANHLHMPRLAVAHEVIVRRAEPGIEVARRVRSHLLSFSNSPYLGAKLKLLDLA